MINHILYHLLQNRRNIIGILICESGELFLGFFKQYFNEMMAKHILSGVDGSKNKLPDSFLVNHISSSFVGMVQYLMKNSLKQTSEELADCFMPVL